MAKVSKPKEPTQYNTVAVPSGPYSEFRTYCKAKGLQFRKALELAIVAWLKAEKAKEGKA